MVGTLVLAVNIRSENAVAAAVMIDIDYIHPSTVPDNKQNT